MIVLGLGLPNPVDGSASAISSLFPPGAYVVFTDGSLDPEPLREDEEAAVRRAVAGRRREFAWGRTCARRALGALGFPDTTLPSLPDRSPAWPHGVVGSITHCVGFVGAVVAPGQRLAGIGFDAEVATPLPEDVIHLVCTPEERIWVERAPPPGVADWPKFLFSAKEAVHKCIAPGSGVMLDLRDVTIVPDPVGGTYSVQWARAVPPRTGAPDLGSIRGRFSSNGDFVFSAAWMAIPGAA